MFRLLKYKPTILVVGDLILDHYVFGSCSRISPEAPVPVLKLHNYDNKLGGACNVASNLVAFGANVYLCGALGVDDDGDLLLDMLNKIGINTSLIFRDSNFNTIKKTRFIASTQQVLRVDKECDVINFNYSSIKDSIQSNLYLFDSIILSDYNKGVLEHSLTQSIISLARDNSKLILCDPKGSDYSKYNNATLITPNKKEAQIATNIKIDSTQALKQVGLQLKNNHNLDYAIITLSEDGMAIFDSDMTIMKTAAKEVFDVTGAGDTAIAALAFGLSCGLNIYDSAKFANAASAVVISKIGSASAKLSEVFIYLNKMQDKNIIENDSDYIALINNLKEDGKKIVFTNGCFDILHAGHISYLKKAKSLGDVLVVGLNSDNSVSRIKGNFRPINNQNDRFILLDALGCVDFVIIFNEDTPVDLIKKIKPDILVKGADYKDKEIAGSKYANEVVLIDYVESKSTTNIINKIKNECEGSLV